MVNFCLRTGFLACSLMLATQGVLATAAYDVQPWKPNLATPALQGTDLNGKTWRLADLRGRAVLLNFWASWCEPCREEMPSLQALAEREGPQGLVVLAINFKESPKSVQRFVAQTRLGLPVLQDPMGDTARQWGIRIYPSTVLISPDGRVRSVVRGAIDWTGPDAERLLEPILRRR